MHGAIAEGWGEGIKTGFHFIRSPHPVLLPAGEGTRRFSRLHASFL